MANPINARIIEETGDSWSFSEGCLSIPELREDVSRKSTITIEYMDENFKKYTTTHHQHHVMSDTDLSSSQHIVLKN